MSSEHLSLFSYEILGLVGSQGAGAHDLLRMAQRARLLAWAGESQYYTEPKRLAKLGYLSAHKEPGKTRERTVYTLTEAGREALREWARTPIDVTPLKSEALIRVLIADLVGGAVTAESMPSLRSDVADLQRRLEASAQLARELPHREQNLGIVLGFLQRFLDLHLELVDAVERQLAPARSGGAADDHRAAPEDLDGVALPAHRDVGGLAAQ